ncbi:MAG: SbcC/MukB-like Walker B domain-containing protein, partial [Marmoricola sp.]
AEDRARKKYESAAVELTALDDVIAAARARAETLAQTAHGADQGVWDQTVRDLQARHAELTEIAETLEPLRAQAAALDERLRDAAGKLEALVQVEAKARAQHELLSSQVDGLQRDLEDALGEHPDAATYAAHARTNAESVMAALAAETKRHEAETAAAQQVATLDLQARSLGFASGRAADDALLADDQAAEISRRDRQRAQVRVAARAVLDDPRVVESLSQPRPDLEPVKAEAALAEEALTAAQARLQITRTRLSRTQEITRDLDSAITRYRPLEAKAERVSALSGLLEGTGADNRLRMRLSAFVLAERLRQVIDAANARLEVISEGRYVLAYREERGAGDSRGGLSLSVLDEWTGVQRDPSTLSGGETFVVSLCLALGLADTVADESGGLRIDTLFIDEGFGSLDAQTLDSVIDILSQLSQGGRVTGVVSHVLELRERLPAVLEVVPSKSGSTVRRASA